MDRCRWVKYPELPAGKFLIPGCWNRVVYGDDADCHCPVPPKSVPKKVLRMMDEIAATGLDRDQMFKTVEYLKRRALEGGE